MRRGDLRRRRHRRRRDGTGCALDAAARGLSVALVEARDFASGTSSRSTKLIHGGLRYLEQQEFGLVREALQERGAAAQRARAPPRAAGLVPLPADPARLGARLRRRRDAALRRARRPQGAAPPPPPHPPPGAAHRARAQARRAGGRHPVLGRAGRRRPPHAGDRPHGGALRRGGASPTPRWSGSCARAGASPACACATTCDRRRVRRCTRARSSTRRASGPTTSRTGRRAGQVPACAPPRASTSSSRATACSSTPALILRTETSVLFVIPWGRHWILGTTDTDWTLDKAHPAATRADIDYVLEHVNAVLAAAARATRTSRASTPGCGRCSTGESEETLAAHAASTRSRCRCPGSSPSRAASTRPTA